jgi:hypothetical protein
MKVKSSHFTISTQVLLAALLLFFLIAPESALPQTPFYEGKTITIAQGRDPGGTGDMRVRAMIPFLQKYTPGNPNIVASICPVGEAERRQITSTDQPALTG